MSQTGLKQHINENRTKNEIAAGLEEVLDAERKVWGFKQFAPLAEARNPRSGFIGQEGLLTLQARIPDALTPSTPLQDLGHTGRLSSHT